MITRRFFFGGLLAAPAIVRASSLMRVVAVPPLDPLDLLGPDDFSWTVTKYNMLPLPFASYGALEAHRNLFGS